jgi:hypothetical protein
MPLSDSSQTCTRAVRPEPSPAVLSLCFDRNLRGLPVLVHEVSRRVWGLRLRRTETGTRACAPDHVACRHYKSVGVRIASFVGSRSGAVSLGPAYLGLPVSSGSGLTSGTVNRFPDPATSNVACGFPALRSPVGFTSRVICPVGQEQLSRVLAVSAYSRYIVRACGRSTRYSTVSIPCLCAVWIASDAAGSSFLSSL